MFILVDFVNVYRTSSEACIQLEQGSLSPAKSRDRVDDVSRTPPWLVGPHGFAQPHIDALHEPALVTTTYGNVALRFYSSAAAKRGLKGESQNHASASVKEVIQGWSDHGQRNRSVVNPRYFLARGH